MRILSIVMLLTAALCLPVLSRPALGMPSQGEQAPVGAQKAAPSCSVCHPGSLASVQRSVHLQLAQTHGPDASCLVCHTDALRHQSAPKDTTRLPSPAEPSCVRCHQGQRFSAQQVRLAAHPTRDMLREAESRASLLEQARASRMPGVPVTDEQRRALSVEGFVRAGWRLVDVRGDERAFDSDFGLDAGPKLLDSELTLRGADERSLVQGSVRGVGERRTSAALETGEGLSRRFGGSFDFSRQRYVYDRDGDFHSQSSRFDRYGLELSAWLDSAQTLRSYVGWNRSEREGDTITSRIGNPGQNPLDPATSVPAYRLWRSDELLAGVEAQAAGGSLSLEGGWLEDSVREELDYARPSPANGSFTERETERQDSSRRGPWFEASYARERPGSRGDIVLRGQWLDTRYVQGGQLSAWDSSAFTVDSTGEGSGDHRSLGLRMRQDWDLWDGGVLDFELSWQDVRERSRLSTLDVTTRGSLVSSSGASYELVTRFDEHELSLGLRQRLGERWELYGGYLYGRQYLSLPDLQPGDADYGSGHLTWHGPYAGIEGGLSEHWSFLLDARVDDTGGRTPTETQLESGYRFLGRLRRGLPEDGALEFFASYRNLENDLASTKRVQETYGASLTWTPWGEALIAASGSWSRIDATSLSTFYFAPSTTPVPTRVGFAGESTLAELSFDCPLATRLRFRSLFSLSYSSGSLSSSLWLSENELVYDVVEQASVGLALQFYRYDDRDAAYDDDYDADVGMLFGELRF